MADHVPDRRRAGAAGAGDSPPAEGAGDAGRRPRTTERRSSSSARIASCSRIPRWRKHALLGLVLACSGVIGLWAVGFYTPDLIRQVQTKPLTQSVYEREIAAAKAAGDTARAEQLDTDFWPAGKTARKRRRPRELANVKQTVDAEIKQHADGQSKLHVDRHQRRRVLRHVQLRRCRRSGSAASRRLPSPCWRRSSARSMCSTRCKHLWQIFVLVPIMGFCQLSLFGGYAIYFPELFPTHLRSTGTSFCYNVGPVRRRVWPAGQDRPQLRLRRLSTSRCATPA